MDIALEIERAKDKTEQALAAQINAILPAPEELDEHTVALLNPFVEWCAATGVRHLPCRPTTVAVYVLHQASLGAPPGRIVSTMSAIEALHNLYQCANPVATSSARFALEQVIKGGPAPRSWTKDEKALWATLPPEVRSVIQRRDADQEKSMRKAQNEAADLRRQKTDGADPKSVIETTTERGNTKCRRNYGMRYAEHTPVMTLA